eukprot:39043_1
MESLEIPKQNKLRFVVRRRHFEAKRREIEDKLKAKSHALTEYKKGIVKYEEQNKIRGKGEEIDGEREKVHQKATGNDVQRGAIKEIEQTLKQRAQKWTQKEQQMAQKQ